MEKNDNSIYYRFFKDSDAAMAMLDREGRILTANEKFNSILDALSHMQDHTAKISLFWSSLRPLRSGILDQIVFEIPAQLQNNGESVPHWFKVHAWRIDDTPQNSENFFIGINLEDNTLVRKEEKKLLEDKEIAVKAMEAKDQFLANMSHEIRTPIQTIIGMTELLFGTNLNQEQSEYSRQVNFSAEVLLSLVNDILDYSKIEAGKMELERIDFDLEQIIEQAVEMIALEAHKKELYIATGIPLETNIIIRGDPSKFRQIVINLVKNAVKFTRDGGIVVSLKLTELSGAEALCVSVADTGIGVSEDARAQLFSTFTQGDVSTTRRFGGTGLGLAISRSLVELMKGRIEMVPNDGGGSIFRFSIPLERSEKKPDSLPEPEMNGKLKILIVDDCAQERNIIVSFLRDLGYLDITQAETGESALQMMRRATAEGHGYQLCFLDMIMPVMDGWRLAAEIHNDNGINHSDLILMVPHGLMGADAKMTLLRWFKAYINKPIKRRRLADTIIAVLNEPLELEDISDPEAGAESKSTTMDVPVLRENSGEAMASNAADSPQAMPESTGAKPMILIVEDHLVNQKLMSMMMDKLGYPSILADDGIEALEKTEATAVDLIFMDIQMPRMNGYEAAQHLRKRGFNKPIIAVTASALSDEREHCLKAGIDDVLVKPFKRTDIEAMLLKWINAAPREPGEASFTAIPVEAPEAAVIPTAAGFNAGEMLDTFMQNEELAIPLLLRFIERTQAQLEGIPGLEDAGDWETARREAHMIKGAALTMGGTELGKAAARLELAYKNTDKDEMKAAYPLVQAAFCVYKKDAEEFIRSRS